MNEVWAWFLENPARLMVGISIAFTYYIGRAEWYGRKSGGSGWLTLFRLCTGAMAVLVTAIVALVFGGIGAFFGYLFLQIIVAIIIPIIWVEKM